MIISFGLAPIIVAIFTYFSQKERTKAETESIKLKNKITKNITYDQLKSESKHKNIKSKLEIFQRLTNLEEEIKSKENKSASDQKKLESLEMIKKEFQETFAETKAVPKLVEQEKQLESKKVNGEEIKKLKPIKPTLKSQNLDKATSLEELAWIPSNRLHKLYGDRVGQRSLTIKNQSKKLPPIHPGEMLREEFLVPLNMKPEELAKEINIPAKIIKDICQEKKALTPEIICRIQQDYERECLEDILENQAKQIKKEIHPLPTSQLKVNGRIRKHA
ncbi:9336_t:CDS:2 [Funneliformis geosporum]|nr:9336_t:CDS:2 [Funneliformis geosporum]